MADITHPSDYRKLVISKITGDFRTSTEIVKEVWRAPQAGEVVIRNEFAGCNAIFDKNLCRNSVRYIKVNPPFDMGIETVGRIVAVGPGVSHLHEGDAVAASRLGSGYREYQIAAAHKVIPVREPTAETLALIPTGISAMVGLEKIAEVRDGDTVAVSAAAGGLGHFVVQFAKLRGCHVIGITGSEEKVALLKALGVDRPINYRHENVRDVLEKEYPKGIDVAYDSVGGEIFDAFVDHVAFRGRVIVSGHTSDFDKEVELVPQPRAYRKLYWKSASIRGFQNQAFPEYFDDSAARILDLFHDGKLRVLIDPTSFVGLDRVADAVEHLLAGKNTGKVVIRMR
jgi:NADPH-dependent curcumin reductase CurA